MYDFLKFYNLIANSRGYKLEIYHSSIVDWCIAVGYKVTHPKHGEQIISIQDGDMELAFAKAHVALKEWMLEHEGGY